MAKLMKIFNQLDRVISMASTITLFLMMVLITSDVVFRNVFHNTIQGTLELTGEYLMVILVYLAVSYTYKNDGHVKVTILESVFGDTTKKIIKFLSNLVVATILLFISYFNFLASLEHLEFNIRSMGALAYPLAPALMIISFGLLMTALRLILENVLLVSPKKNEVNNTDTIKNNTDINGNVVL